MAFCFRRTLVGGGCWFTLRHEHGFGGISLDLACYDSWWPISEGFRDNFGG